MLQLLSRRNDRFDFLHDGFQRRRAHLKIGVRRDFGLDFQKQFGGRLDPFEFLFGSLEVAGVVVFAGWSTDGQHEIVEVAMDFAQFLVLFGLFAMFQKRAHHPKMTDQFIQSCDFRGVRQWFGHDQEISGLGFGLFRGALVNTVMAPAITRNRLI